MKKILVIENKKPILKNMLNVLITQGYDVIGVDKSLKGLELLGNFMPDLIVCYIGMPDLNGYSFLKEVRKNHMIVPFIFTILRDMTKDLKGTFSDEPVDYLLKPFSPVELIEIVKKQWKNNSSLKNYCKEDRTLAERFIYNSLLGVDEERLNCLPENINIKLFENSDFFKSIIFSGEKLKKDMMFPVSFEQNKVSKTDRYIWFYNFGEYGIGENNSSENVLKMPDPQEKFIENPLYLKEKGKKDLWKNGTGEVKTRFYNMIGKSHFMQDVYQLIEDLADVDTTVLITGESGTGKELVAEALHCKGIRKDNSIIKVNCVALSENLLESELFGHVKGSFTGAVKDKTGRFEKAHKGTIFLDEIGDISPAMQLRLLRILQEKEFERVGDLKPIKVDVRVIAATNQDLRQKIKEGKFREDLYYRLKVVEINLPSLRERKEDVFLLIKHFIEKFNKKFNKNIRSLSIEAEKAFLDYSWPGNIRELEHTMEYAFIRCKQNIITPENLPREFWDEEKNPGFSPEEEEKRIREALELSEGKKARAARILGMSRPTLYKRMEDYGIK